MFSPPYKDPNSKLAQFETWRQEGHSPGLEL